MISHSSERINKKSRRSVNRAIVRLRVAQIYTCMHTLLHIYYNNTNEYENTK